MMIVNLEDPSENTTEGHCITNIRKLFVKIKHSELLKYTPKNSCELTNTKYLDVSAVYIVL